MDWHFESGKWIVLYALQSGPIMLNGFEVSLTMEHLENIGLLRQHLAVSVASYSGKAPPSLQVLRITLVAMRLLGMFPVP